MSTDYYDRLPSNLDPHKEFVFLKYATTEGVEAAMKLAGFTEFEAAIACLRQIAGGADPTAASEASRLLHTYDRRAFGGDEPLFPDHKKTRSTKARASGAKHEGKKNMKSNPLSAIRAQIRETAKGTGPDAAWARRLVARMNASQRSASATTMSDREITRIIRRELAANSSDSTPRASNRSGFGDFLDHQMRMDVAKQPSVQVEGRRLTMSALGGRR